VFEWWFQNRILENAAALHYTTEDEWRLAAPVARNPHGIVAPNGLNTVEFVDLPASGSFWAQHPEIGDRPIILVLGRLNFRKGLDLLAPAFGYLLAAGHDAHLVIAGPDDDMADKLRGWLSAAGSLDRNTFTGMITDATMFVPPSYSEKILGVPWPEPWPVAYRSSSPMLSIFGRTWKRRMRDWPAPATLRSRPGI